MRRVPETVPLDECKHRCLEFMRSMPRGYLMKASEAAVHIWPEARFTGQGAGAAASRILTALKRDGLVSWKVETIPCKEWGYFLTASGHARSNAGRH